MEIRVTIEALNDEGDTIGSETVLVDHDDDAALGEIEAAFDMLLSDVIPDEDEEDEE